MPDVGPSRPSAAGATLAAVAVLLLDVPLTVLLVFESMLAGSHLFGVAPDGGRVAQAVSGFWIARGVATAALIVIVVLGLVTAARGGRSVGIWLAGAPAALLALLLWWAQSTA